MDNKKQSYSGAPDAKSSNQPTDSNRQKSTSDTQTNKHWPRNSRRREKPSTSARNNNNNNNKQYLPAKARPNVGKRPRARGYNSSNNNASGSNRGTNEDYFATSSGLEHGDSTFYGSFVQGERGRYAHTDYELDSVYTPGSKKKNLNHLLNFYYTPREVDYYDGVMGNNGNSSYHRQVKKHKYNKEQFLQANFQFVIKASANRKTDYSPDTLIDWSLIEQINIQTSEEPQCPICLYPPVATKVTRCGHVYCWPCILHYLSLTDKTWRKCPICYDAIHVEDLKSAVVVQQQEYNVNSHITFRLMRRKKGSLFIEKYDNKKTDEIREKYPYFTSPNEDKLFSKFILAKRSDVADILARERKELLTDVDELCPEYVFIQQALEILKERAAKLGEMEQKNERKCKLEENVNVPTTDNVGFVEHTEQHLHTDINQVIELPNDVSPINNESNKVEEDRSEPFTCTESSSVKSSPTKFYYFYQADDGQNIYLHPINVKMLQACYDSLSDAPSIIKARIIQKEQHSMDEDHRRKFTCLGHLPLTCQFAVVEIDLQPPYVTENVIQAFKADILLRKKERQRRAAEERKREKYINAINDRKMGKIISSTANINISSSDEFPTCGFEDSLVPSNDLEPKENGPSTSKGCRTKTVSTSSTGSCSYSAIAIHCQKEHTPWSNHNASEISKSSLTSTVVGQTRTDEGDTSLLNTIHTNLGDVLAQALSQKKTKSVKINETTNSESNKNSGNKKSKKSKKMLPLYSTGMNFSGN